jgi:hypothetical protein
VSRTWKQRVLGRVGVRGLGLKQIFSSGLGCSGLCTEYEYGIWDIQTDHFVNVSDCLLSELRPYADLCVWKVPKEYGEEGGSISGPCWRLSSMLGRNTE